MRHLSLLLFISNVYTAKLSSKSKAATLEDSFESSLWQRSIEQKLKSGCLLPSLHGYFITKCSCSSTGMVTPTLFPLKTQFLELNVVTRGLEDRIFACIGFVGHLLKFLIISRPAPIRMLIGICLIWLSALRDV